MTLDQVACSHGYNLEVCWHCNEEKDKHIMDALVMLKNLQWQMGDFVDQQCPVCLCDTGGQHESDCDLAALITKLEVAMDVIPKTPQNEGSS